MSILSHQSLSMNRKITINNGKVSTNAKKTLRKSFDITIRGLNKQKQKVKILREVSGIVGEDIKNLDKAYEYLAEIYNDILDDMRAEELKKKMKTKNKTERKRKQTKKIKEITRNFKLTKITEEIKLNKYKDLKATDILKIITETLLGDKVVIGFKYVDGDVKYRPLNDITIGQLTEMMTGDMIEEVGLDESDKEFMAKMNLLESITIEVPREYKTKAGGSFFKYIHKTDFDLEKYGIFTEVSSKNYENNCLINCFIAYGCGEEIINNLKCFVVNREVAMCRLEKVANKLKMKIILRKLDSHKKPYVYGKDFEETINIGLVDNHYFLIEKVDFTMYALKNYFELREKYSVDELKYMIKKNERNKDRTTDSFKVINYLFENKENYLMPIALNNDIMTTQYHSEAVDLDNLEYTDDNTEINEYKEQKEDEYDNVFFDFETYNKNVGDKSITTPYMVCGIVDKTGEKLCNIGEDCGKKFLDKLSSIIPERTIDVKGKKVKCKNVRLIAHNCGFDYRHIFKYLTQINQISGGTKLLNANAVYFSPITKQKLNLEFKCSLKLITCPLKKFSKMFKLQDEKEVMPYELYNEENNKKQIIPIENAKLFLNEKDYEHLVAVCEEKDYIHYLNDVKCFDIMEYSKYYCMRDCEVLRSGYNIFRGWILDAMDMDINTIWTSASLSDKYFMKEGVYDGVYKLSGVPRVFIQKCVVGGRTMCRDNVKHKVVGKKIADYDGVSLYPSSMERMRGILKGKPKILQSNQLDMCFLNSVDGYFVKIMVKNVSKHRGFSLLSEVQSKSGVRLFHNYMEGKTMYVDKTTLEDMINFQGVDFDILCGYYYDEGRNDTIRKVIRKVFDMRRKMKAQGNPIQEVYKLIMNSGYGRSILKPIDSEERVFDSSEEKDKWVSRYYNYIIEYTKGYDCDKWIVKQHKEILTHFNNCVFGVEVLSMSKRIMNEVMCLGEDLDLNMYYQDTDSIHIEYDDVAVLKSEFKKKYHRELDGKDLGQFHIDFELDGAKTETIYAEKSIFLGKKCYIDCLVGKDDNGNEIRGHHIRMKGVPNYSIEYEAERKGCSVYELYEKLYDGEDVEFDLLCGGKKSNFKFNKNMSIYNVKDFKRVISFNSEED